MSHGGRREERGMNQVARHRKLAGSAVQRRTIASGKAEFEDDANRTPAPHPRADGRPPAPPRNVPAGAGAPAEPCRRQVLRPPAGSTTYGSFTTKEQDGWVHPPFTAAACTVGMACGQVGARDPRRAHALKQARVTEPAVAVTPGHSAGIQTPSVSPLPSPAPPGTASLACPPWPPPPANSLAPVAPATSPAARRRLPALVL